MTHPRLIAGATLAALSLGCSFLGFPVSPFGRDVPAPVETAMPGADASRGQSLYNAKCLSCHGADGKGAGSDVRKETFDALKAKQAGSMASFMGTMTDADLRDLEAYLAGL